VDKKRVKGSVEGRGRGRDREGGELGKREIMGTIRRGEGL